MQLHTLRRDNASIEFYIQKAKGIVDRLAALQHPISNDDLVEFVLVGIGHQQLKRDETINVIAPTAHFTKSSFSSTQGRGRGRGGRGRGCSSNQEFTQQNSYHSSPAYKQFPKAQLQVSEFSGIIYHNCEGKGHIARVCPSPKANSGSMVNGRPISNFAGSPNPPTQTWLMDSGITHHITIDLDNLGIHSEYQGPEEVTLGNGSKLPISHVGKSFVIVSNNKFNLDNILHVPTATHNLLSYSSFAKSNNVSVELFPNHF
uniref:Retrovirus-related Pol polyprotein from transposon TNT 1-94-like beta-barrel domain-containing protein n=1 Tax=Nicotiana tabacum TaxID=4097 RepID=A0A1S4DNB7_TOBAC|nr:PREDICTED: uncharacterized protein LOC107831401 [Nicotiana tabacum]